MKSLDRARLQVVQQNRRYSRRPLTAEARLREMSTQVPSLQTELASVKAILTEARRRPSRYARALASIMLCGSGSAALVITGIRTGLLGSTIAGESSTFQTEARLNLARSFQAVQPVISLEERKGAAWVLDHLTKADVRDRK
jgi:hypothetical protein